MQWLCEAFDATCKELDSVGLIRSINDGKKVLLVIGGSNSLGKFIRISDIDRNGHGFSILVPSCFYYVWLGEYFSYPSQVFHWSFGG